MIINVGSTNNAKLDAVKETILEYPSLKNAKVRSRKVTSDVQDQPKSLDETIKGAMNRARNAFTDCDLAIGIESGLMAVPYTKTGYMDVCVCAMFDGQEYHIGLSSAFEYPKAMTDLVLQENIDITQAANRLGFSANPALGSNEGMVGILTKGRVNRKAHAKQALITALIHLEHKHLWKK